VPCVTYPGPMSSGGLPLGIQVIGPVESDERLVATAKWMRENSGSPAESGGGSVVVERR
jgi:Asp-tRNA(Asn)/Glu-tRNA(Gln) amidotransferase A subunit family amidase